MATMPRRDLELLCQLIGMRHTFTVGKDSEAGSNAKNNYRQNGIEVKTKDDEKDKLLGSQLRKEGVAR